MSLSRVLGAQGLDLNPDYLWPLRPSLEIPVPGVLCWRGCWVPYLITSSPA